MVEPMCGAHPFYESPKQCSRTTLRVAFLVVLRLEGEKTEWYDQENYQETMRDFKNKRKNFLNKRELFNYSKTELQNLMNLQCTSLYL